MSATILLFDIDGTLLDAGGAGRRAMEAGFGAVTGRPEGLSRVRFAGMTDPSIVREGLLAVGRAHDELTVRDVIAAYLQRLPAELRQGPPRVLPGVPAVLDELATLPEVAIGVGTGNVEQGAWAKLEAVALRERFAFGGFGSDHEQRAELLRVGARRGAAQLGRDLDACRVLVIGDTPRDIEAARAIGAACLAVATSFFPAAALREAGAERVVEDLADGQGLAWLRAEIDRP